MIALWHQVYRHWLAQGASAALAARAADAACERDKAAAKASRDAFAKLASYGLITDSTS
jgi:hypothetical protein